MIGIPSSLLAALNQALLECGELTNDPAALRAVLSVEELRPFLKDFNFYPNNAQQQVNAAITFLWDTSHRVYGNTLVIFLRPLALRLLKLTLENKG